MIHSRLEFLKRLIKAQPNSNISVYYVSNKHIYWDNVIANTTYLYHYAASRQCEELLADLLIINNLRNYDVATENIFNSLVFNHLSTRKNGRFSIVTSNKLLMDYFMDYCKSFPNLFNTFLESTNLEERLRFVPYKSSKPWSNSSENKNFDTFRIL